VKRLDAILFLAAQFSAAGLDLDICRFHAFAFLIAAMFQA